MSGEIRLQALTGLANVKAAIYDQNGLFWDGSDFVDVSTLTDIQWRAGLVACTEEQTSDASGTGLYLGDQPGTMDNGIYSITFYSGAAPNPDDPYIGTQQDFLEYSSEYMLDAVNTGTTHNVSNSVGKQIRQASETQVITSGTAQGPGANDNQIQLAAGESAVDGAYDPALVVITGGTGTGQTRLILQYAGATKTATVDRSWKVNPDATSEYIIAPNPGREHVNEGLAQAGTANTVTLNPLASSVDNAYVGQTIFIRSGLAEDQSKVVIAYNGTTKVATVDHNWDVIPDTTSGYVMLALGNVRVVSMATSQDVYHADIEVSVDGAVPQTADEYTVIWYKNGEWVQSGVTLPKIQVFKYADGTDLIALTAMTEVGAKHVFKYTEGANILTYGEPIFIVTTATIAGSTRTWIKSLFRDNND